MQTGLKEEVSKIMKEAEKKKENIKYPILAKDFIASPITPPTFYAKPFIPKDEKTIVSAQHGVGKTWFLLALAYSIAKGEKFLGRYEVEQAPVLFVEGEGGESELFRRLQFMGDSDNFHIAYANDIDLIGEGLSKADNKRITGTKQSEIDKLSYYIEESKARVVFIDPVGQFWSGDENKKDDVRLLTKVFDQIIDRHGVSIALSHHWKKPSVNGSHGSQMASGSYWWNAWADVHITLQGSPEALSMYFEKIRNAPKPQENLILALQDPFNTFEVIGEKGKKLTGEKVDELFTAFRSKSVKFSDLTKRAIEQDLCSKNTLLRFFRNSPKYCIDASQKDTEGFFITQKEG